MLRVDILDFMKGIRVDGDVINGKVIFPNFRNNPKSEFPK